MKKETLFYGRADLQSRVDWSGHFFFFLVAKMTSVKTQESPKKSAFFFFYFIFFNFGKVFSVIFKNFSQIYFDFDQKQLINMILAN